MTWLFSLVARLPLRLVHALGAGFGWLAYWLSPTYARRMRDNLAQSGIAADEAEYRRLLRANITEAGKGFLELFVVWGRPLDRTLALVRETSGLELLDAARAAGRGVIVFTPHLGCFEVVGLFAGARMPMTSLYRPPRLRWLQPIMEIGRGRSQSLAPTDVSGVRKLLAALKRGEAIGMLPDQVPGSGEGVWSNFFGRPAYTMTLVGKLVERTGATVVLVTAERLPRGQGYRLRCQALPQPLTGEPVADAAAVNGAAEMLVRQCPEQYLWSYNRYKTPKGAKAPEN